jgi:hypothetical protein
MPWPSARWGWGLACQKSGSSREEFDMDWQDADPGIGGRQDPSESSVDGPERFWLLGLPTVCWRCGHWTTALVGVVPVEFVDLNHVVTCEAEPVLRLAAAALPEGLRRTAQVGAVKPRYSRTARCRYLSNGCARCDALLGNFFLYTEGLPFVLAQQGFAGLVKLAVVELSDEQVDTAYEHGTNWSGAWLPDDPCCDEPS